MLKLRTFGTVHLVGDDGIPLEGAAGQRRLLAVLTLVAAAGDAGISRDRVLALLWPEGEPERARRNLAQSLYHARKVLGRDDIFVDSADLRLNRGCIASDIAEFEEATARGDLEGAARLYAGPFLDGFLLSGSVEFEHWVGAQRMRFARQAHGVLEQLAMRAEQAGDWSGSVTWRRRMVATDPLDARATVGLMTALASAGDRAGALQHARVYESLLRAELDVEPDSAVTAMVDRLRTEPREASTVVRSSPAAVGVVRDSARVSETTPEPVPHRLDSGTPPPEPPRRADGPTRWHPSVFATLAAAAIIAVMVFGRRPDPPSGVTMAPTREQVVVVPFRISAADPALAYLSDGMVELLSARLGTDSVLRTMDPGAVLRAWRRRDDAPRTELPRADIAAFGRSLGASRVIAGSVVGSPGRLVITAALVRTADGGVIANAVAEGSADTLTALVDRLAVGLLAHEAGESERLARLTSLSLPALRSFLDGQAAFRQGDYSRAAARYESALRADSSFALAALQLALAADRINNAEQHDRALAIAWSAREELAEHDRAYLIAFAGPRYPAPSAATEHLMAWERAVGLAPDRAEAWSELGERYFRDGAVVGLHEAMPRAGTAFRRALALDPTHVPSRQLLIQVAARSGDTALLAAHRASTSFRDSVGQLGPSLRWRVAVALGDTASQRRERAGFGGLDIQNLRGIAMASQFDGIAAGDGERALRILRNSRVTRAAEQLDALLAEHSLALNEGRPVLALDITEQIQEAQPGWGAHLRLRVLDALYAEGDRGAAQEAALRLRAAVTRPARGVMAEAVQLADACVLGQWRLARGDTASIAALVTHLRGSGLPRVPVPIGANPHMCAELLDATLAVETRRRDALTRVAALDALMLSGPAVGDGGSYAHLAVARLFDRLGDRPRALAAIRRRPYMTGWPRYLATTRVAEARLAAALGEPERASEVYERYLRLRANPEPGLVDTVARVRAEAAVVAARR